MIKAYRLEDFNYNLPEELIAKYPNQQRDKSKLLTTLKDNFLDLQFNQIIDFLNKDDLLVLNNSKVINARLLGRKTTGGKIEILIERIIENKKAIAHIKSNKTITNGLKIILNNNVFAVVYDNLNGLFAIEFFGTNDILSYLNTYGLVPIPPYMEREADEIDNASYQTVYAKNPGSVAAPTAGLHFTEELLTKINNKGVKIAYVTLHVGSGTFKPVNVEDIAQHKMHSEIYHIEQSTIDLIKQTKQNNHNIIAVGTTSIRVLETIARDNFQNHFGETDIFITPGFKFQLVDKLITNFHLPKSTLLMLVSAFAGFDEIKKIYQHAINSKYKFFSYGDAMLLNKKENENE
jgi:S-adenosylmethionine:tRNA ribosyltransferase-isomerase